MNRLLTLLAVLGMAAVAQASTWTIDTRHSSVGFSVRNFFVPVEGSFRVQSGTIVFDSSNPSAGTVEAVIAVTSVNTQDADRDKHLNNEDFFLTSKFPTASFKSTKWEVAGENKFKVTGDLTIKDVTRPVTLDMELLGVGDGGRGRTVSGWHGTAKINRKDWGIDYGASIANEVNLTVNVQGIRQ